MVLTHGNITKSSPLDGKEPRAASSHCRCLRFVQKTTIIAILFTLWNCNYSAFFQAVWAESHGTHPVRQNGILDFAEIIPSEKLDWQSCFGEFKCARLTVAMDYQRPLNQSAQNPKVHIALLLIPGKHGSQNYSNSPILLNPGGPGGSGAAFAANLAPQLQRVLGEDRDIIGFDPRGVGSTTPRADCYAFPKVGSPPGYGLDLSEEDFARGDYHRFLWAIQGKEAGLVNSTPVSLKKLDFRARTVVKLCNEKDGLRGENSIFKYADTPSVARDMLSIVDAWDEWTTSLGPVPPCDSECHNITSIEGEHGNNSDQHVIGGLASSDTKGKLVYWGFSYGTLLGATFASMFPNRVGRLVLDGVIDADDYVTPLWSESLHDADKVLQSFHKYCFEAKEQCSLYRPGDSAVDIQRRFEAVLDKNRENSITMIDARTKSPMVLDINDFRQLLFLALYSPTRDFPVIALIIDILYRDDLAMLASLLSLPPNFDLEYTCGPALPASMYSTESLLTTMCSDKKIVLNETVDDLQKRFEKLAKTSTTADSWMTTLMGCNSWGIKAVGPPVIWGDDLVQQQLPINTSFPVLFISNTADPVTPLIGGLKMAKKFAHAGFIEQKSEGHCTLAAVSSCTIEKIRAYFNDGKVPPPPVEGEKGREIADGKWDRCEADEWPFHPYTAEDRIKSRGPEASAEAMRMTAYKEMQLSSQDILFWRMRNVRFPNPLLDIKVGS